MVPSKLKVQYQIVNRTTYANTNVLTTIVPTTTTLFNMFFIVYIVCDRMGAVNILLNLLGQMYECTSDDILDVMLA